MFYYIFAHTYTYHTPHTHITHPFRVKKTLNKIVIEVKYHHIIKSIHDKTTANTIHNGEDLKLFLKSRRMPLSPPYST